MEVMRILIAHNEYVNKGGENLSLSIISKAPSNDEASNPPQKKIRHSL